MAEEKKLFKVTIDNITIEVEPRYNYPEWLPRKIGGDVVPPAMCYYTKLQGSGGKCRTCLVGLQQVLQQIQGQCPSWLHLAAQM